MSAADYLPVLPTGIGEGDPCPACVTAGRTDPGETYNTSAEAEPSGFLMASTDDQPLAMCDSCGAEYRTVGHRTPLPSYAATTPHPGYSPPKGDHYGDGECMRLALACVVGKHPSDITWIAPRRGGEGTFWEDYEREAQRLGYVMTIRHPRGAAKRWANVERPTGLWIAQVPGSNGHSTHAIVLDGDRLYFDSGPPRKRHPNLIHRVITLEHIR